MMSLSKRTIATIGMVTYGFGVVVSGDHFIIGLTMALVGSYVVLFKGVTND